MSEKGRPIVIRFFAYIDDGSINTLMHVVDSHIAQGVKEFVLIISSVAVPFSMD